MGRIDLDGVPLTDAGTYMCCDGYGEHADQCDETRRTRLAFDALIAANTRCPERGL